MALDKQPTTVKVHFFYYKKKLNSTNQARPWQPGDPNNFDEGGVWDCYFSAGLGVMSGSLSRMNFNYNNSKDEGLPAPEHFNYAYIQNWKRYYWVSNWTYDKGFWSCDIISDPLATFKEQIGNSTQYILRSDRKSLWNGRIIDDSYPTLTVPDITSTTCDSGMNYFIEEGWYVVGLIAGEYSQGLGGVKYYVMTPPLLRSFYTSLLGDVDYITDGGEDEKNVWEISKGLTKALVNPFQYVASIKWYPFEPPMTGVSRVQLGWWTLKSPLAAGLLDNNGRKSFWGFLDVPKHPQAEARGEYLNSSPYSEYNLEIRPWGRFPIDASVLASTDTLYWRYEVDFFSGKSVIRVTTKDSLATCIFTAGTDVGVDVQVNQIATLETVTEYRMVNDNAQFTSGISYSDTYSLSGSAGVGVDTGSLSQMGKFSKVAPPVVDLGANLGRSIAVNLQSGFNYLIGASKGKNAVGFRYPQTQTSGCPGTLAGLSSVFELTATFWHIPDEDPSIGRPCYCEATIDGDDAYFVCNDVELEIEGAYAEEVAAIAKTMENGFWYERGYTN